MPFSTAPALLVGLGLRILLDLLNPADASPIRDSLLVGCWLGIALSYSFQSSPFFLPLSLIVALRTILDWFSHQNPAKTALSVVGIASGFLLTDFLSSVFDAAPSKPPSSARRQIPNEARHRHRRNPPARRPAVRTVSDITSVDSNSEMIGPRGTMNPLERDIAALRARASLADSERRRFKEERKWAKEQGNRELASQMKWEIKRYTALMNSFHREADLKVAEAAQSRARNA